MYASDRHIYHTTERGTKVRAFWVSEGSYLVETHSDRGARSADAEESWDVPIGFVQRNPLTRGTERFSLLNRESKPSRGATTAVRQLAEEYDRMALGDRTSLLG